MITLAADQATRIAEKHLAAAPVENRGALATDIVDAIKLCQVDLAADIIRRFKALSSGAQRPGSIRPVGGMPK